MRVLFHGFSWRHGDDRHHHASFLLLKRRGLGSWYTPCRRPHSHHGACHTLVPKHCRAQRRYPTKLCKLAAWVEKGYGWRGISLLFADASNNAFVAHQSHRLRHSMRLASEQLVASTRQRKTLITEVGGMEKSPTALRRRCRQGVQMECDSRSATRARNLLPHPCRNGPNLLSNSEHTVSVWTSGIVYGRPSALLLMWP